MQRENKWQDRLNKILWKNTDIVENPERPMKAQLHDDLLVFIQSEINTAIAEERESNAKKVLTLISKENNYQKNSGIYEAHDIILEK